MKTLIVNRSECAKILTEDKTIPYMKNALAAISEKQTQVLQRTMLIHENGNKLAIMPASSMAENVTGAKITIFPGAETARKGTSQGIVPLFDIETGALISIVDAKLITVVRTAATSAAATDVLAKKDSKTLAILGCGKQGRAHVRAVMAVRNIEKVYAWSLHFESAQKMCDELGKEYTDVEFIPCETAKEAVVDADIICTTTPGKTEEPVLRGEWIKKGAHINAVGACTAKGREVDGKTIEISKIFTDWNDAVRRDGGDFLVSIAKGELKEMPELCEAGAVINGKAEGRTSDEDITFFESVGISVEDVVAAKMIYEYAKENDMGTYVEI